jgi:hypothetical protein
MEENGEHYWYKETYKQKDIAYNAYQNFIKSSLFKK